ncbi:MAG: 3-deoxy-manno-octulosonate cytidylyltransferase [Alphaproteobacteria bacterium]|nr:3-deoxy-manno-octulosonate cytidylyltransferase [Alphaproteobacteria bacterium]
MRPFVLIPSRLAATRLPNKPLADIAGVPMIVHVWRRAREADIGPVLVAAGDQAIVDVIRQAGGDAVLTDPKHPTGSDRIWEAVLRADPDGRHDVIVNVQGDLPTLDPKSVRAALAPLAIEPGCDIGTLTAEIVRDEERTAPHVVKIAVGFDRVGPGGEPIGRALYFSRATIPAREGPHYHHIGLYAYRRAALARFVALPPGILERRESLEQLRALENGMRIDVARVDTVPLGIDTPDDLARARAILSG